MVGGRGGEGRRRRSSEGGVGGGERGAALEGWGGEEIGVSWRFCRAGQMLADSAKFLPTEEWFPGVED